MIAEDSSLFAEVLLELLSREPGIEVLAVAENGEEAVELCAKLRPDLILMDIHMPRLDGLSATEAIMASTPTPILVLTADPHRGGVDLSFRALSAGALDLMAKPNQFPLPLEDREKLLRKIHLLSQIPVVRHVRGRKRRDTPPPRVHSNSRPAVESLPPLVGIVASTGGPKALARILQSLPKELPAAIIIVQHITDGFSLHLARWLNKHSPLQVRLAEGGERPEAGHAYIAPTGMHLFLSSDGTLQVDESPPIGGHRPSGDRLLMSLARHGSSGAIGVVLSGMGDDGTAGLSAMHKSRCPTLAQDEETSVVYGMPRSAAEAGVVDQVLPDKRIAPHLIEIINDKLSSRKGER